MKSCMSKTKIENKRTSVEKWRHVVGGGKSNGERNPLAVFGVCACRLSIQFTERNSKIESRRRILACLSWSRVDCAD